MCVGCTLHVYTLWERKDEVRVGGREREEGEAEGVKRNRQRETENEGGGEGGRIKYVSWKE